MENKTTDTSPETSTSSNSGKDVFTPDHSLWDVFKVTLTEELKGEYDGVPICNCKNDFRFTIKILNVFDNIDVDETTKVFQELGGYCDCEVLSNVEKNWKRNGRSEHE